MIFNKNKFLLAMFLFVVSSLNLLNFNLNCMQENNIRNINFEQWRKICLNSPKQVEFKEGLYPKPLVSREEYCDAMCKCIDGMKNNFNESCNWIEVNPFKIEAEGEVCKKENANNVFFVQKADFEGAELYVHADIHGDIHSTINFLDSLYAPKDLKRAIIDNNFKIINDSAKIVFLGDYTDRGVYGIEVLYTIARLKAANPRNVFLLRGNHEDCSLNHAYGLVDEFIVKFGDESIKNKEKFYLLREFYNLLPVALFMGFLPNAKVDSGEKSCFAMKDCKDCVRAKDLLEKKVSQENIGCEKNYILFCHGGIEFGFNPNPLLSNNERDLCQMICALDISWLKGMSKFNVTGNRFYEKVEYRDLEPNKISFLWGDFCMKGTDMAYVGSRGRVFSKELTNNYIESCSKKNEYSLKLIIRGHQHNEKMLTEMLKGEGLCNVWNPKGFSSLKNTLIFNEKFPVFTLNASPGYNYSLNIQSEREIARREKIRSENEDSDYERMCEEKNYLEDSSEVEEFNSKYSSGFLDEYYESESLDNQKLPAKYNYDTFLQIKACQNFKDLVLEKKNILVYK